MRPESNEMPRRYQGAALPGPGGGGGGQGTPRSRPGAVSPACCQLSSATGNGKKTAQRERDCPIWEAPLTFSLDPLSVAAACDRACFCPLAATGTSLLTWAIWPLPSAPQRTRGRTSGRGFVLAARAASTWRPTGADWHRRPGPPGQGPAPSLSRWWQQQLALQGG